MINPKIPWPSYVRITTYQRGKRRQYRISFDGLVFDSIPKFAKFLGISTSGVYSNLERCKNLEELRKFVKKALINARYGLPLTKKVYVRGKDCVNFVSALQEHFPGISETYLRKKLQQWEDGKIDCDDLYKPIKRYTDAKVDSYTQPRSEEDIRRVESIKNIPGPTEIERRLWNL